MWALDNRSPYAADRTWVRDPRGRHHWVVAVKASYVLSPAGALELAQEQAPLLHAPLYFGEPASSSVRSPADLVAPKPGTDLLVNAHAHAPQGRAVTELPVALRLGEFQKLIMVEGERNARRGGLSSPEPFRSRPIRYEGAYGGTELDERGACRRMDARNPVGRGVGPGALPYLAYPGAEISRAGPAGFGAIASHWSPRRELYGSYDEQWSQTRRPLLPRDYDARALLSAALDQRPRTYLEGGELVELVHMSPREVLRVELPRVQLGFETHFGRRVEAHTGRLVTVLIEPEEARVYLTWHSSLEVGPGQVDALDRTIIQEHGA